MNLKELQSLLEVNNDTALRIKLPSGECVPDHFHITEVGTVHKSFVDCGGTRRESVYCSLQVWTANDVEHRLVAGRLAKILRIGANVFEMDGLPVEVEYGADVVAHYVITNVEVTPNELVLVLVGKRTDCLAPDKCGVAMNKCCTGSGCC